LVEDKGEAFGDADFHVVVVPTDEDGLRRKFADAHGAIPASSTRHRWTGHLWQGRFGAVVMDEEHLAHATRYVGLNPVRA
jgi:putative transposase